jgi:DNA-directed RNA polymerase subunit L
MIKNFNEFVNESVSTQKVKFSIYDEINEPFVEYIRQEEIRIQQEQEDLYKTQRNLEDVLRHLDMTVEDVKRDFEDVIVGEPKIVTDIVKFDDGECEVKVIFDTNVPFNYKPTPEEKENEDFEDPEVALELRAMKADQSISKDVRVSSGLENAEGNCTLEVFVDNLYV